MQVICSLFAIMTIAMFGNCFLFKLPTVFWDMSFTCTNLVALRGFTNLLSLSVTTSSGQWMYCDMSGWTLPLGYSNICSQAALRPCLHLICWHWLVSFATHIKLKWCCQLQPTYSQIELDKFVSPVELYDWITYSCSSLIFMCPFACRYWTFLVYYAIGPEEVSFLFNVDFRFGHWIFFFLSSYLPYCV